MPPIPRLPELSRPRARRGFTLIEILAVMVIIGILGFYLVRNLPDYFDTAEVRACSENLHELHAGMMFYKTKYDRIPSESGVAFFAELVAKGAMSNTKTNARRLTCPAVDVGALAVRDLPPQEWWTDLDAVDGTWSAYAGRDCDRHPLRKFPGDGNEPLMADDNDGGMNHRTTTNVLYTDGSVQTFELFEERDRGTVGEDEDLLLVGPDSPIDDLQKLSLD